MFNSYDKDKFIVGDEYYTYYMELTNKGNRIKNYTGILKVKVLSNDIYTLTNTIHTTFEILKSKKLSNTLEHNIYIYMNGYGNAFTYFFNTYEEAIIYHNREILKYSKKQKKNDKERILKLLII